MQVSERASVTPVVARTSATRELARAQHRFRPDPQAFRLLRLDS